MLARLAPHELPWYEFPSGLSGFGNNYSVLRKEHGVLMGPRVS